MLNSLVFIIFAFSFGKPQSPRDWRSFGAFSASFVNTIIALNKAATGPDCSQNVPSAGHNLESHMTCGFNNAVGDMQKISGQKPVVTKAKKSIAIWKIRTGYPIGCMVTLRQDRMYEFLDRLVSIALPRVRDFRGVSARSFDGRGNFNLGVKEQIIFPEIEYDKIDVLRGMNITIATTAKTDAEAKALLAAFKFPFKN